MDMGFGFHGRRRLDGEVDRQQKRAVEDTDLLE